MSIDCELIRLSIGAFLTSPGAGILGLIGAGLLAYVGVDKRLEGERKLALDARKDEHDKDIEADARERWQQMYAFLWDNREDLGDEVVLQGLESLGELSTTKQQAAMIRVFTLKILDDNQEDISDSEVL